MAKLKIGTLVRVKSLEEIKKLPGSKIRTDSIDLIISDDIIGSNINKEMLKTLGSITTIKKVSEHLNRVSYKLDNCSYIYFDKWLEPLNTKAAKVLFSK